MQKLLATEGDENAFVIYDSNSVFAYWTKWKKLHKKWSFPLSISSVNVTKSAVSAVVTFTEEILNENFIFLCSERNLSPFSLKDFSNEDYVFAKLKNFFCLFISFEVCCWIPAIRNNAEITFTPKYHWLYCSCWWIIRCSLFACGVVLHLIISNFFGL